MRAFDHAPVVELVDTAVSKTVAFTGLWVRIPPGAHPYCTTLAITGPADFSIKKARFMRAFDHAPVVELVDTADLQSAASL